MPSMTLQCATICGTDLVEFVGVAVDVRRHVDDQHQLVGTRAAVHANRNLLLARSAASSQAKDGLNIEVSCFCHWLDTTFLAAGLSSDSRLLLFAEASLLNKSRYCP